MIHKCKGLENSISNCMATYQMPYTKWTSSWEYANDLNNSTRNTKFQQAYNN